ncbi:MAG: DUF4177 domain-containing protein [Proteobacteria bacterium]|nr:DUF4177 domain-containing protein [Pseudomonadota bacterium]MBU1057076.1 DUF4177 domain-containing protein [Pseudomonadota bacterium]
MRWSYKTVRFGLKKEGILGNAFLDESEIELSLNEFGKFGWELVSFMEVQDGVIGVFKQPLGQGWSRLEKDSREEETEGNYVVKDVPPLIRKTATGVPDGQGQAREQVLEEDLGQEEAEPDERDVGSIRIE